MLIDVARIASLLASPPHRYRREGERWPLPRLVERRTLAQFGAADGADAEPEIERAGDDGSGATRRAGGPVRAQRVEVGVNAPGVSYQFFNQRPTQWQLLPTAATWSFDRPRQARAGVSLARVCVRAGATPFAIFGLGQTNDYGRS